MTIRPEELSAKKDKMLYMQNMMEKLKVEGKQNIAGPYEISKIV